MTHTHHELVADKVRQVIYGGDEYDPTEVFDESEYPKAKRMLSDYLRPDGDQLVQDRVENVIEQLEVEE